MTQLNITVGAEPNDSSATRDHLARILVERLIEKGILPSAISRHSDEAQPAMAAGAVLSIDFVLEAGTKIYETLKSFLALHRTSVEIEMPDGQKVKISAANFHEAKQLLVLTGFASD